MLQEPQQADVRALAGAMTLVLESFRPRPSLGASAVLLVIWLVAMLAGVLAAVLLVAVAPPPG
ncbi:MAG: hypothetical protein R2712_17340 [Vicinamibacterales bacterium]